VIYLNEEEVKQLLPMDACVTMMRRAFEEMRAGRTRNQPRRRLILDTGSVLHQMAGSWGNYFVTKIYSSNRKYGGVLQMINLLYDAETGKPLAYLEANNLGMIRTGAASGYATDLLAAPDASVVGMIGSGWQARGQVEAMRAVRPIQEIRVWSRKLENAERFAKEKNCRAVESAEEAVRDAPIVVTATSSKDAVIEAAWIKPGTMINAMGSNVANRREIPADLVRAAGRVVVDDLEQARIEAGDLILADSWANVVELKDVERGHDPTHVTIFESLGIAVEDAAAAAYVYEQAVAKGIGRPFP
jgi:ornithine cyclodeaminase/alanine dehydrogenase-like protein (mu-crystallin family)